MKFAVVLLAFVACTLAKPYSGFEPRIHGGHAAAANQFTHQVSLTIPVGQSASVCGGSLISTTWVLTAAHCVSNANQVNLRFGSISRFSGGVAMVSTRIVRHANFNPINLNNDIALLGLPSAIDLSPAIQVIRMPARSQAAATFVGFQATVSGWGETAPNTGAVAALRWVSTRVISNTECLASYSPASIVAHVVCTVGVVQPSQGTCGGDSGGPLYITEGGINTQIGVVAFGNHPNRGGCSTDHPSAFMRTSHFLDWINSHTGIPVRA